jgi:phosphoribosylamine--glycine ligase
MKTVVVGSGGREHAIAWALAKSSRVSEVICVPGNGGTAAEPKCRNIDIPSSDLAAVVDACVSELSSPGSASTDSGDAPGRPFVVVGPEDPLAAGLADRLSEASLRVVGPMRDGAALEASKDTAKRFMDRHGVACAKSETFTDAREAIAAVRAIAGPCVVKADGLAAGKGVVVAPDAVTAERAIKDFMLDGTLGSAGRRVVIEEYLRGDEISILAAVSVTPELAKAGKATIVPFVTARDHKRLRDGAKGPNTGGMGAIAPVPGVGEATLARFRSDILEPTLKGLIEEGRDYRGFIFFGLMLTETGPKLLEYNVRLGDPETQAVLPLMDFDFSDMCDAIVDGTLADFRFAWKEGYVCAPVAVSAGYPGEYAKGKALSVDAARAAKEGAKVFIAGAKADGRAPEGVTAAGVPSSGHNQPALITSGGRVLASSAFGQTVEEARDRAYRALEACSFEGMFYRKDIGLPGAAASGEL